MREMETVERPLTLVSLTEPAAVPATRLAPQWAGFSEHGLPLLDGAGCPGRDRPDRRGRLRGFLRRGQGRSGAIEAAHVRPRLELPQGFRLHRLLRRDRLLR